MTDDQKSIARACLDAAEQDAMPFPEIVATLIGAGFEGYAIDLLRSTAIYYLPDGASVELVARGVDSPVSPALDSAGLLAAIREAQQQVPGYSYLGFCEKAAVAGCASYYVSISGARALYIGRTGETHVEHFPAP